MLHNKYKTEVCELGEKQLKLVERTNAVASLFTAGSLFIQEHRVTSFEKYIQYQQKWVSNIVMTLQQYFETKC